MDTTSKYQIETQEPDDPITVQSYAPGTVEISIGKYAPGQIRHALLSKSQATALAHLLLASVATAE